MQSPTEREKIFTQRVLSGGDIQRIDLTNVADQWNGEENNFGLQIEIENGSSDHFRWVAHLWLILYESYNLTQGQWVIKVYLGWDVLLAQNWMTHQFYFLILMMVLQARNYLDLEGKISAITSLLLRSSKIYEPLRNFVTVMIGFWLEPKFIWYIMICYVIMWFFNQVCFFNQLRNDFRRTRTDPSRRRKSKKRLCQRRELYVDFSMVDWHQWIVAPPGYQAYICDVSKIF